MCATLRELKNFLKYSILVFMKMLMKLILALLRGTHRKCLWTIFLLIVIIIYLRYNCDVSNKTNYDFERRSNYPVIAWWTSNFPGTKATRVCSMNVKCDIFSDINETDLYDVEAYLFYGSQINIKKLPLRKAYHIWGLYHEESPRNLEELMHEPMLMLFNFSATFSRHSDVPFPLQYLDSIEDITSRKYFVPTSVKNKYLNEISPIMYLQSDCETSTERDIYVKELMKFIKVDSYGICLNNKELPKKFTEDYLNNLNEDGFLHFVARYKFVIAIENGICEDYITEKLWRPIKVGSVPIYFGSPTIKDWLPNDKSVILLEDFPTPKVLSDHINKLLNNDTMYEEYLEHKTKQIITNAELVKESRERPYQRDGLVAVETLECLVCEHLHNRTNPGTKIVNKSHYNCPKPISALTLSVNPSNSWVSSWNFARMNAEKLNKILTNY